MFAIAESAVVWRSAAILLATKSGHEVPLANTVNAMTYGFIPEMVNIKSDRWIYATLEEQYNLVLPPFLQKGYHYFFILAKK